MALFRISVICNLNSYQGLRNELFKNGIVIIAAILALVLIFRKNGLKQLESVTIKWIAIGIFVGLVTAFFYSCGISISNVACRPQISLTELALAVRIQLTGAAVREEPLFRGILWGVMRKMNFEDKWIWIVQAILFFTGHIYYLNTSIIIWLLTLFAGLVFGVVVWKSRSMTVGMIVHTMVNSFGQFFLSLF